MYTLEILGKGETNPWDGRSLHSWTHPLNESLQHIKVDLLIVVATSEDYYQ